MSLSGFFAASTFLYQKCNFRRCLLSADDFMNMQWHEKKPRSSIFVRCDFCCFSLIESNQKKKKKSLFFPSYDRTTVGCTIVWQKDVALKVHRPFVRVKEEVIYLSVHLTSVYHQLVLQYDRKMCPDLDGCCRCTRLLI